jgi:hypothetical protein
MEPMMSPSHNEVGDVPTGKCLEQEKKKGRRFLRISRGMPTVGLILARRGRIFGKSGKDKAAIRGAGGGDQHISDFLAAGFIESAKLIDEISIEMSVKARLRCCR